MYHLVVFLLSVNVTEEVKGIVRRGCRSTTESCQNDVDERVKLVVYPLFCICLRLSCIAANPLGRRACSLWTSTMTGDPCEYRGAGKTRTGGTPHIQQE